MLLLLTCLVLYDNFVAGLLCLWFDMRNGHYIFEDGRQIWCRNGKLHRLDGPAVIDGDYQAWYKEGKRHRLDGPAVIDGDYQVWYKDGLRHRIDGPAIINGKYTAWWIEGKYYIKEQFDRWLTNHSG